MSRSLQNAFVGSLIADAVSMPVHWYYDTGLMDRDYGRIDRYLAPKNPHADSILWRSHYHPKNARAEILHEQAQYWGQRGVHYHQFLGAGENTLNFRLAIELYRLVVQTGSYDADAWLALYIERMTTPGWHRDTYVEEFHRAFFDRFARGENPRSCGIVDQHIGGLSQVPALLAALALVAPNDPKSVEEAIRRHVALTHRGTAADGAALALVRVLSAIAGGLEPRAAIETEAKGFLGRKRLESLAQLEDRTLVGRTFSSACYLPESFNAALSLAWKYAGDFEGGILANARCGGDNCHRGAVVGAILGASNPIPQRWIDGLLSAGSLAPLWQTAQ